MYLTQSVSHIMPAVGCRKGHRPRQESRQPPQPQTREEQLPHDNNALGTHLLQTIAGLAKQVQTIQNQHTEIYQKIDKIEKRQQENYSTYGRQDLKFQTMDRRMEKIETVSEQQNRTIKELMNDKYERFKKFHPVQIQEPRDKLDVSSSQLLSRSQRLNKNDGLRGQTQAVGSRKWEGPQ